MNDVPAGFVEVKKSKDPDPKCVELARHFLEDYGAADTILADLLAERIQGAVEDWCEEWFESGDRPALTVITNPQMRFPDARSVRSATPLTTEEDK